MTMLQFLAAIAPPLATLVSGVISLFVLIDWLKAGGVERIEVRAASAPPAIYTGYRPPC